MKKKKHNIRIAAGHGIEWHAAARTSRIKNGLCTRCGTNPPRAARRECEPCGAYAVDAVRKQTIEVRARVFNLLGGGCIDCKTADQRVLTVDHINGDGGDHRKIFWPKRSRAPLRKWRAYARAIETGSHSLALRCYNCHAIKDLKRLT